MVKWRVGPGVRCDLLAYSAKNLSGKRTAVQLFPTGARRGDLDGTQCSSVGIRALHGTRVILAASDKDTWELAAWRCIRVLPGTTLLPENPNGLPGLRVPDLDALDPFNSKRAESDLVSTYPNVAKLEDGEGWTFGRNGTLKNRIRFVWVEREDEVARIPTAPEKVARAILSVLQKDYPDAVGPALNAAVDALTQVMKDPQEAVGDLRSWVAED